MQITLSAETRTVLENVRWDTFVELSEQRRGSVPRMTFDEVDLTIDPPPDLVIEVEITSSAIQKLKLFAAMGVPEVWRHDGERLQMFTLSDGKYNPVETSHALGGLTAKMIDSFLDRRFDLGETAIIRGFRQSLQG